MHPAAKPSRTLSYGLVSACYWMSFAAALAFVSAYLLHNEFSNTVIGLLIAFSGGVSALLQPVVSGYADREESPSVRLLIMAVSAAVVLDAAVLTLVPLPHAAMAACYCIILMLLQILQPLVNALSMETVNQGYRMNFGIARAGGSLGYAFAAFLMGNLVAAKDAGIVPLCILVFFGLLMVSTAVYPFRKERTGSRAGHEKAEAGGSFFRKYPAFAACLAGLVLIYFTHALLNNYTLQIIAEKGGSEAQMGTATSLAACLELLVMLGFTRISARVPLQKLVKLSGVFFTVKILATWLVRDVTGFYVIQLFQIPAWGIMAVALVCFVNEITEPGDHIKGQAYATTSYTIGAVLGSLAGGALIDLAGIGPMLLVGSAVGAVGSLLIWLSADACTSGK